MDQTAAGQLAAPKRSKPLADTNEQEALKTPGASSGGEERKLLAPVWHTIVLVLILFGSSAFGYFTTRRLVHPRGTSPTPLQMIATYAFTLVFEWVLFFFVFWGERRYSGAKLSERFGGRWSGAVDVWRDIGLAMSLWFVLIIVGAVAQHVVPPPHKEALLKLLPSVWWQLIPWTMICISAGICEEYVFRGHLMEQFRRLTGIAWLAIVLQALVFGLGHGYQGMALMFSIFLLGVTFGIAANSLKTLRVNMIAHGWTDFFSGVVGYLINAYRLMPGR